VVRNQKRTAQIFRPAALDCGCMASFSLTLKGGFGKHEQKGSEGLQCIPTSMELRTPLVAQRLQLPCCIASSRAIQIAARVFVFHSFIASLSQFPVQCNILRESHASTSESSLGSERQARVNNSCNLATILPCDTSLSYAIMPQRGEGHRTHQP
jgi:hypothetical protein